MKKEATTSELPAFEFAETAAEMGREGKGKREREKERGERERCICKRWGTLH